MKLIGTLTLAVAAIGLLTPSEVWAVDDPVTFLHALQSEGYADIAAEYLEILKEQPDTPAEIRDLWDLEMSKSLRAASRMSYNEAQAKQRMDEAEKYMQKFVKEKPNHPEAVRAAAEWAGDSLIEALQELQNAKGLTEKDKRAESLAKARKLLQTVLPRFQQATADLQKRLKATPAPSRAPMTPAEKRKAAARQELQDQGIEARLRAAICEFYIGETYVDSGGTERRAALEKAAKTFDEIFQENRGTILGLNAHFWHGRAVHEKGETELATEIYDEVLAAAPDLDPKEVRGRTRQNPVQLGGLEGIFASAQQYRLQIMAKKSQKDYLREAYNWWNNEGNKGVYERTDGWQGMCFDLAKAYLALAEKAKAADKPKVEAVAVKILRGMIKIPSQYQQEAIKLLRTLKGGDESSDAGYEENAFAGDQAARAEKWADAITAYEKALAAVKKKKDQTQANKVRAVIAGCHYYLAVEQFNKSDLTACWKTAGTIVNEYGDSPAAVLAAKLAVNVALYQMAAVPENNKEEKDAAQKRAETICNYVIKTWPGKAEADFARISLGKIKLFNGQIEEGIKSFNAINPQSDNYAMALYLVGYTRWRQYKQEKAKPEGERKQDQADALRAEAAKKMAECVAANRKLVDPTKPMPRGLLEAQLLLADMSMEGGDAKEAAALFQPLVDGIVRSTPESLDPVLLQIFNGTVRAYLQLNDIDNAGKVAAVLIKLGPDDEQINRSLVEFAKKLDVERKKAEEEIEAKVSPTEIETAKNKVASYEKLLGDLMKSLAARGKLTAANMVWIAETCAAVGLSEDAEAQCEKILAKVEQDKQSDLAKGEARIRTLLISILRKKGKFAPAYEQVKALEGKYPKALEPKMETGRILQAWAEKDPDHYSEAVMHWEKLRRILDRMGKPDPKTGRLVKPREFYEVTYNEAFCLHDWAKQSKDKENAKKGEQLLRQLLVLDSELSGPDMVLRYKALLDKLEILQGKEPSSKKLPAAKTPAKKVAPVK